MFDTVRTLLEMIRFSHTLFALPFAMLAAMMAWSAGHSDTPIRLWRWQEVCGIVLCMVTARSYAMAINRLADRDIDAANPRTEGRHLPAGKLSVGSVRWFAACQALAFVVGTLLFLPNRWPILLSIPVLGFLAGYSYAKRFTSFSHVWLGVALAFSPVAAWLAIRGEMVSANPSDLLPAWILGGAVLTWVTGFDIIYACQDVEFDRQADLHSIPARLGIARALRMASLCHVGTIALLALLPFVFEPLGWIFGTGVTIVAALLLVQHALVRPDDLTRVNIAFFHINAVISLGLFAVGALDLALGGG